MRFRKRQREFLTVKENHTTRTHLHNEMEGEWQFPRNIYSRKKNGNK